MHNDLIHIYFMPGMAANPTIFEYIELPKDQFKVHWLEWIQPTKEESISNYAERMCLQIKEDDVVLLGVSFGGILVQEMSRFIKTRKVIVISSVINKNQLPKRFKIAKKTMAYKLLPTQLLGNIDQLAKFAFGEFLKKRIELYKRYLSVNSKEYLDWAIKQVVCWEQEEPPHNVIQIHGDKDGVFTNSCIGNCIVVKGGTHIMIINKFKWFNENLPKLIVN